MNVTRRSFLATAAIAAAAPVFLGATDKAGNKPPILGDGEHKYEALHDWGELPQHNQIRQHSWSLRRFARQYLYPSHGKRRQR